MMPVEDLLNNHLEQEIQRMVYPLNLMQRICVCSKYAIRDSFITPTGKRYNCLTLLVMVALVVLCIYNDFLIDIGSGKEVMPYMYLMSLLFAVLYIIGFMTMLITNCMHSATNVFLVLNLQEILKSLNFEKGKVENIIIWNWILTCCTVFSNLLMLTAYYVMHEYYNLIDFINDLTFVIFDTNIVYSIRIIALIREYIVVWTENFVAHDGSEARNLKSFEIYKNILYGYNLYKTVSQALVLFHTIDTFFRCLSYVQFYIEMMKLSTGNQRQRETALFASLLVTWLCKNVILEIIQSIQCEKFYITIEEAEDACIIQIMESNSDERKRVCFHVLVLNKTLFRKMSACGLFDIDAAFPLRLLGLITNYIVVLLQFAFL